MPDCPDHGPAAELLAAGQETLVDLLDHAVARYADRVAFVEVDHQITYREVGDQSLALAATLQRVFGITPGDRVAIMLPNGIAFPIAAMAILRCGGVIVNINPLYTGRELRHQLDDAGAVAIIASDSVADTLGTVVGATKIRSLIWVGDALPMSWPSAEGICNLTWEQAVRSPADKPFERVAIRPDDLALLQYTGGTTGFAKGAMLRHRNVCANRIQICLALGLGDGPVAHHVLTVLPLYHIFAFTVNFVTQFSIGACNILVRSASDMDSVMEAFRRHPISLMTGVNTLYANILAHPAAGQVEWRHLRFAIGGGSAILATTSARWRDLTGDHILEGLGMTETSPVMTVNPPGQNSFSGTVGLPLPGTEIVVLDDTDKPCPPGVPGEICVRGPQLMAGYWGHEADGAGIITSEGFFRSGDIGSIDHMGYLTLVDRKKDMILVSGFNVYPNEVEAIASEFPGVRECACIGVPDERSGEAVKLCLTVEDPANFDRDGLLMHCRSRLAAYKIPRYVVLLDALPKSAVGKILRRQLS